MGKSSPPAKESGNGSEIDGGREGRVAEVQRREPEKREISDERIIVLSAEISDVILFYNVY